MKMVNISLRIRGSEKLRLQKEAGKKNLSDYIRKQLKSSARIKVEPGLYNQLADISKQTGQSIEELTALALKLRYSL